MWKRWNRDESSLTLIGQKERKLLYIQGNEYGYLLNRKARASWCVKAERRIEMDAGVMFITSGTEGNK